MRRSMMASVLFAGFALVLFPVLAQAGAGNVLGYWFTEGNKSKVEIEPCGDKLCGKIVWLKEPKTKEGKDKTDAHNPDKSLRSRKILGLALLSDFVKGTDGNSWEDGKIYNPEDGETYKCTMTLQDDGTLEVRGYVGIPLFGKSQIWTRAK